MKNLVNDEEIIEKVDTETIEPKNEKSDNTTLIIGIIVIVLIIGIAIYLKIKDVEPENYLADENIS
jgi:hypothetical protein